MTHPFIHRRLGDILVEKRVLEPEQLQPVLSSGNGLLGERLVKAEIITQEHLAESLADQSGLTYVDLAGFSAPADLFKLIPASQCYQFGILPYQHDEEGLFVIASDPNDYALVETLERRIGVPVRMGIASARAIESALKRSEGGSEVLRDVSTGFKLAIVEESEEGHERAISLESLDETGSPVIKLVNAILVAAMQKRASDIHIETYEQGIIVKNRIDGVLYHATDALDRRHQSALISRLKVMSQLDIAEKRVPQDGRFKIRFGERDIDFRISVLPSVYGEDVVIRILDKTSITENVGKLTLENLGLQPEVLRRFQRMIHEPYGMVLITGPTGSGKTTTLYAALNELDSSSEKIITIEDPVEYQLEGVVQIPVNEKKNLTFARGLRSILRHDPDKIMIGEIRDTETVQIAVQSALTGHLVFTTVHANNAFDVINRFSHMGVNVNNFISATNCVMAQRLVRTLCQQCRHPEPVEDRLLEDSGLNPEQYRDTPWFAGRGCEHCGGTGYRGRTAVTEFLNLSLNIRELILARRSTAELQAAAIEEGMITLRQSALSKALAGETTLAEINRVTFVE